MSPVAESYLGISGYVIFWVLFVIGVALFVQRVYLLVNLLRLGRAENRFDRLTYRFFYSLVVTLSQWCNLRSIKRGDYAGIGHAFMFWGFCFFLLSYVIFIGLGGGFGLYGLIKDTGFDTAYSSILDIAAVIILIALIWAAIRRYILKPERLKGHPGAEAGIILAFVGSLMILHICIEGFNFAAAGVSGAWPPVGGALGNLLINTGISQNSALAAFNSVWWLHYLLILGFLVFIPRSKHLHILASSINVAFKDFSLKGALKTVDISQPEALGASRIQDFSWKQLLDGYACTVCGRCHDVCPARTSGKPLSPRELILNVKDHLLETGPDLLKIKTPISAPKNKIAPEAAPKSEAPQPASATPAATAPAVHSLIGQVVKEDEIWACTTCRACQEVCPSYNEQMSKIIEMRRYLQMVAVTETGREPLKNMRVRGHPWRGTTYSRTDWAEGLDIKVLGDDSDIDVLYFVGCTGAMEDRSLKIAQATAKLLKIAGVKFGILGEEETCCGDPARRLGAEHIFQMLAQTNIQMFQMYNVKKIVTACPHCFNTLKNEYPQFGGQFEVVHHTQFIADLIKENKLKVTKACDALVTYHESCYLGRYNNIYQAPREVISSIPRVKMVEMARHHQDSFCCGGGGGRMWLEENIGQRISEVRLKQALDVKAEVVATACPFCLQMFEDAAKARGVDESLKVQDISELILAAVSGDGNK
jgi:Fe-S oxidoreductase